MTEPVTRGEMHEALSTWAGAIIDKLTATFSATLSAELADVRAEYRAGFVELRAELTRTNLAMAAGFVELRAELTRTNLAMAAGFDEARAHIRATEESILSRVDAMFDPHRSVPARVSAIEEATLPERVSKLESRVFAPAPKRGTRGAKAPAKSRRRSS